MHVNYVKYTSTTSSDPQQLLHHSLIFLALISEATAHTFRYTATGGQRIRQQKLTLTKDYIAQRTVVERNVCENHIYRGPQEVKRLWIHLLKLENATYISTTFFILVPTFPVIACDSCHCVKQNAKQNVKKPPPNRPPLHSPPLVTPLNLVLYKMVVMEPQ